MFSASRNIAIAVAAALGIASFSSDASAADRPSTGAMALLIHFDRYGNVAAIKVARSSGNSATDAAVVASAHKWHSKPAKRNGLPVDSWVTVPVALTGLGK
jgi:TonB family protein